ncbi:MAG: TetR/AcrR family transcriptional regulator [Geminicoccaceae bacterium]
MRVSKEQAARNRERVIEAAGRLFREHGFDGVGIDAVMAEAGLTHGGFYKSFASKDDLIAEACRLAAERSTEDWLRQAATSPQPLRDLVTRYLSSSHCSDYGDGCLFAALATDAGRRDKPVRAAFAGALKAFTAHLTRFMPGRSEARRREAALAALATMIGAVAMARAAEGEAFADEVLTAARTAILGRDGRADSEA